MVFELGQTVATCRIDEEMKNNAEFAKEIQGYFMRYVQGDWGDTCASDCESNNEALKTNNRIVALYKSTKGDVFIITEWDRSATTILFADEY